MPIILSVFPKEFDRYIEIFGGSGAVLLGKPESKFEVYNDIDGELVNCFRVIKNRPAELMLELDLLPLNSRAEFNDWLHFHNGGNDPAIHLGTQEMILERTLPKEWAEEMKTSLRRRANYREVRQAAAFLMRIRNSYSSSGRSFACQPFNIRSLFDMIWEMSFRLANVIIEQQSVEVLIPHYDRVDSFFYGDPPYYDSEYVYEAEFDWDHHVLLKDTLVSTESARQHKDATDLVMQPYQETVGTLVKSDHKGISNQLIYKGHVTLGVGGESFRKIRELGRLHQLPMGIPEGNENAVWVQPQLVCTVKYMMKTESGGLRQPVFKGLRDDKCPEECVED